MKRSLIVALAAALVVVAPAAAGEPYKMANRALFERSMRAAFVVAQRRDTHKRYAVKSIGCAKGGIGRWACAVAAVGPAGVQLFSFRLTCPTDKVVPSCDYVIVPM